MLSIDRLSVKFGSIKALNSVSLSLHAGETVCILGPNGAGKSTLLNCISGLVPGFSGNVFLNGNNIATLSPHEIYRRGVVQCPEDGGLFASLRVSENLKLAMYTNLGGDDKRKSSLDDICDLFPIVRDRWSQTAGTLSGGEQRMVSLARCLLACPKVLLLDEPCLGLAPFLIRAVYSVIKDISMQGIGVLIVEQNVGAALEVSDRGYSLRRGKIAKLADNKELRPYVETKY